MFSYWEIPSVIGLGRDDHLSSVKICLSIFPFESPQLLQVLIVAICLQISLGNIVIRRTSRLLSHNYLQIWSIVLWCRVWIVVGCQKIWLSILFSYYLRTFNWISLCSIFFFAEYQTAQVFILYQQFWDQSYRLYYVCKTSSICLIEWTFQV